MNSNVEKPQEGYIPTGVSNWGSNARYRGDQSNNGAVSKWGDQTQKDNFFMPFFTRDSERIEILKKNYQEGVDFEKFSKAVRKQMDISYGECDAAHLKKIRQAAGYPE